MRYDFGRCVIERERRGSSNRSLKVKHTGRFRQDGPEWEDVDYDGPTRIPSSGLSSTGHGRMLAYHSSIGEKDFTDVLGPVYGYLHKAIGRPWDEVFSEVSARLGRGGQPMAHVLHSHLLSYVDTHTYYEGGKVWGQTTAGRRYHSGNYYVHPLTGILCCEFPGYGAYNGRRYRYRLQPDQWTTDRVADGSRWFVFIKGLWYIGMYRSYDAADIRPSNPEWPDAADVKFVKLKQAGKKELRRMRAIQAKPAARASKLGKWPTRKRT